MKKLLFILVVVLIVSNNVSAQQKPEKGSFGTEIQFNPFDQNGKTFQLDGLKFRYFISGQAVHLCRNTIDPQG